MFSSLLRGTGTAPRRPSVPAAGQEKPGWVQTGAAVPYAVELGLTVLHTALYAALFLFAYLQLWLLLYYRERRLSYHTLCLFLCLLWAALRTTLFSFYLQNSLQALRLQQPFAHWLLYCLPGCLLFSSLCLLNLYFAEVSFAWGEAQGLCPGSKVGGRGGIWGGWCELKVCPQSQHQGFGVQGCTLPAHPAWGEQHMP
uniref:G protein-coupled receptor 137C n=1 Tax=Junco hyemalis TaxID=40217 RepID=A0A8C5JRT9_JUNHY